MIATAPKKEGVAVPTEAQLRDTIAKAEAVAVTAWADAASARALMERCPTRRDQGSPRDRAARRDGGALCQRRRGVAEADRFQERRSALHDGSARAVPRWRRRTSSSRRCWRRRWSRSRASAGTALSTCRNSSPASWPGPTRRSRSRRTRSAVRLVREILKPASSFSILNFTKPGNDDEAFANILKQLDALYANREQNPGLLFGEKVGQVNSGNNYTADPLTRERLAKLDRDAMVRLYKERFSNAADFTFVMVGAFKVEEALPLAGALRRLAAVNRHAHQQGRRRRPEVPVQGREGDASRRAASPRSRRSCRSSPIRRQEPSEITQVASAADVLELALRDILREELGETYGGRRRIFAGAAAARRRAPVGQFHGRARKSREDDRHASCRRSSG